MKVITEYKEDIRGFLTFYQSIEKDPNKKHLRMNRILTSVFKTKEIKIPYNKYNRLLEKHFSNKEWISLGEMYQI